MNDYDIIDERILFDGRNTYETIKHIATSNNKIAYSNSKSIPKLTTL